MIEKEGVTRERKRDKGNAVISCFSNSVHCSFLSLSLFSSRTTATYCIGREGEECEEEEQRKKEEAECKKAKEELEEARKKIEESTSLKPSPPWSIYTI